MLSAKLKSDIRKLWDRFWSGGIANPLTAIEQITYLIFLKRLEDLDIERTKASNGLGRAEHSIFEGEAARFKWSILRRLPADEQVKTMRDALDWLKELNSEAGERLRDAVFVISNPNLLRGAIEIIDELFVPSRNQDTLGDVYEMLLAEIAEAGKNGQFRTPRHIIRAMCDLVDPRLGEKICDPACGTAGFLVNTYQHILAANTNADSLEFEANATPLNAFGDLLTPEQDAALRTQPFFFGFDFDRTMVRLGWMNLILHGLQTPQVINADTLGSRFNEQVEEGERADFDVILANPPFTGNLDKTDIGRSLQTLKTNKTELLFVELIIQMLRTGGRAAVIVPEGVLFGSTTAHKDLRKRLLTQNQLNAVISLPGGVFQPYTGVKTSILVFNKGGTTEKVWFYEVKSDGLTLNAKRTDQPAKNDLWDMVLKYRLRFNQPRPAFCADATWQEWQALTPEQRAEAYAAPDLKIETREVEDNTATITPETAPVNLFKGLTRTALEADARQEWTATLEEIQANDYNLAAGRYKPASLAAPHYDPPSQIIAELQSLETQIQTGLTQLLAMVRGE